MVSLVRTMTISALERVLANHKSSKLGLLNYSVKTCMRQKYKSSLDEIIEREDCTRLCTKCANRVEYVQIWWNMCKNREKCAKPCANLGGMGGIVLFILYKILLINSAI